MPGSLVLLHGFGGTHRSWDAVRAHLPPERYSDIRALDLPGHGAQAEQRPIDWDVCVESVLAGAPQGPFVLAGYSLGGRVAQHVAEAAPERIERLVLISTTPGIIDPAAREQRAASDDRLATEIATMTAEQFADRWQALDMFAATPPQAAALWREDLLRNDPADLAEALRALSPGRMRLFSGEVPMPLTVVTGERDERYRTIAERFRADLSVTVPGAGHGLPREAPAELAAVLSRPGAAPDRG